MSLKGSKVAQKGSNPDNTFDSIFPGVSQPVAVGAASVAAATPFGANVSCARFCATTDCHIAFGPAPTAVADGTCVFLPGGIVEYFGVNPGDKVAVIQDSAAGTLYVTPGSA